jgi:prevent-host-death family protein
MSLALHALTPANPLPPALWRLQDAKAKFSSVVDNAMRGTPQFVTRRGQDAVVVLAKQDYDALQMRGATSAPSFLDHLLRIPKSPTDDDSFGFERQNLAMREVNFG